MTILELLARKALINLSVYCKKIGEDQTAQKMDTLLGECMSEENQKQLLLQADKELVDYLHNGEREIPRFFQMINRANLTPLGMRALEFVIAQVYFPEIGTLVSKLFHTSPYFTLEDVIRVLEQPLSLETEYPYLLETYTGLAKILEYRKEEGFFFRKPLVADKRLLAWLCMEDEPDKEMKSMISVYFAGEEPVSLYIGEDSAKLILASIQKPDCVTQIAGEINAGRKYLLKYACDECQQNMLFLHFKKLLQACRGDKDEMIQQKVFAYFIHKIKREMLFYDAGICIWGTEEIEQDDTLVEILLQVIDEMQSQPHPVCVTTDNKLHLIDRTEYYMNRILLPPVTRPDRKKIWDGYSNFYGMEHIDTRMAAQKYRLNPGEIQKAAHRIYMSPNREKGAEGAKFLAQICEEVLPSPVAGQIQRNMTKMGLEDLKLPQPQKDLLAEICAQVNHRQTVFDDWGMERKYAYGKNVSALFIGPPGTGKTMAVDIISGLINLPVYKIDLSQVVDKYIGETEKKLEVVFNLAQKSNTILFFDEADSIFGKRSEVNEAKDRYANTEVSYILQRIEQYDGIVILASNYKKNIDEAFLRRMRYLVEFPMPDAATREEIWKSCFTEQVPVDFLDFAYLAKNFELSGGSIKNVVLNAVFMAARDNCPVGMKQVLVSLRNEKMKMGKPMILSDFGQYAPIMKE